MSEQPPAQAIAPSSSMESAETSATPESVVGKYSRLVALPHSVFALPFALSAFLLAARQSIILGQYHYSARGILYLLALVIIAVVSARTAAMGFNRIVDAVIDAQNPRTANREIPTGKISQTQAACLVGLSIFVFLGTCALLGDHCLRLAPLVLLVLLGYSFTKRFSRFSHLFLGLALGLSPAGAWWVLRPTIELTPVLLIFAVLFWVAGFDILYSCQDAEFDRRNNLFSIPAHYGIEKSLTIAKIFHLVAILAFVGVGLAAQLSGGYFVGLSLLGVLFLGQHLLISANDLSRINHAFFTFNGAISLGYFVVVCASI